MAKVKTAFILPKWENKTAPCAGENGCPAGTHIAGALYALSVGDTKQAWEIMMDSHPFRGVLGRVCYGFCEKPCNRGEFDSSIAIQHLEMVIGDEGFDPKWKPTMKKLKDAKTVAIIGAGPAGLTAAYFLVRAGLKVEVFEKSDKPGGMLRYGIPRYRLDRKVLDREINFIVKLGVKLHTGQKVDDQKIKELESEFDSVLIASGASKPVEAEFKGSDKAIHGLELLHDIETGDKKDFKGKDVIVVGGGNVAMDACRSAIRLKAKSVTVVYRRTLDEMPAHHQEYVEAVEETVGFKFLLTPVSYDGSKIVFQKNRLSEPDESGRRKAVAVSGETEEMNADILFMAIGQQPEDLKSSAGFMAGDVKPDSAGTVIHAIADGKIAADAIYEKLTGNKLFDESLEEVTYDKMNIERYFDKRMRLRTSNIPPSERVKNFIPYLKRASLEEVVVEADRCFKCGTCIGGSDSSCDWCFHSCRDDSIDKKDVVWGPSKVLFEVTDSCDGCGRCWEYCPRYVVRPGEFEE